MKTSDKGIAFLERHEGVVLKSYRDPVGIWTIGAGLTKASGVVVPKAGLKITKTEASRLLQQALNRNYEPSVNQAMPKAAQPEFDGGVSFHWNTGAIARASWVKRWREGNWAAVRKGLLMWTKGGGKVLPGLVRRRREEFALISEGLYSAQSRQKHPVGLAKVVVPQSKDERTKLRAAFTKLGYQPGEDKRGILVDAVRKFQRDHDLTPDGIIGRATLSTVQRMLDASIKSKTAGAGGAVAAAETQTDAAQTVLPDLMLADWLGWIALAGFIFWLAWLAFTYRDALAVKVQSRFPKMASFLRSF